jgi:hypothetical protein
MFKKPTFGEMPYEHIPAGIPNPGKDIAKNFPQHKLLEALKKREKESGKNDKAEFSEDADETEILTNLAKALVEGNLPPEIEPGSEFYQLLQEIAKKYLGMSPITDSFLSKEDFEKKHDVDLGEVEEINTKPKKK